MKLTFGKHKGKDISCVDDGYLTWLLDNVTLSPTLKAAIESKLGVVPTELQSFKSEVERLKDLAERERRRAIEAERQLADARQRANDVRGDVVAIVQRWFRTAALEWHPDRRHGSTEGMTALNVSKERLDKMLGL